MTLGVVQKVHLRNLVRKALCGRPRHKVWRQSTKYEKSLKDFAESTNKPETLKKFLLIFDKDLDNKNLTFK